MQTYILKRLLLTIPMLFGITFISFCVMQLAPGTAGGGAMGEGGSRSTRITPQQYEVMRRTFHLDKPIYMRYLYWLGIMQEEPTQNEREALEKGVPIPRHGILYGDFGYSMEVHAVKVWDRLVDALPVTLILNGLSMLIMYVTALPIGIYSATHQNSKLDHISSVTLFMLYSMPSFWVAVLLIKLVVMLPPQWRLPIQGIQPPDSDNLTTLEWLYACCKHLVLPLICLTYASFAGLSRYMRSGMIDVIRSDFVRTARAKGLPNRVVVYKHALRNSLIPIITLLGSELPALIGGSVIIEAIFGIPGMGYVGYKALIARDYTVLMADLMLVAVMVMAGFLLSDLLYKFADPRISFDNE
jgi:peptide/nickel transport system permease protein